MHPEWGAASSASLQPPTQLAIQRCIASAQRLGRAEYCIPRWTSRLKMVSGSFRHFLQHKCRKFQDNGGVSHQGTQHLTPGRVERVNPTGLPPLPSVLASGTPLLCSLSVAIHCKKQTGDGGNRHANASRFVLSVLHRWPRLTTVILVYLLTVFVAQAVSNHETWIVTLSTTSPSKPILE